jgi:hypothetical protein
MNYGEFVLNLFYFCFKMFGDRRSVSHLASSQRHLAGRQAGHRTQSQTRLTQGINKIK